MSNFALKKANLNFNDLPHTYYLLLNDLINIIRLGSPKYGWIGNFKAFQKMGLLPTDIQTQRRKKLFSIFPYFYFSFIKYLIVSDQLYNWTCTTLKSTSCTCQRWTWYLCSVSSYVAHKFTYIYTDIFQKTYISTQGARKYRKSSKSQSRKIWPLQSFLFEKPKLFSL